MRRRLKISSKDRRYLIAFVIAVTLITSGSALYTLNPPPSEQFFALWVLGSHAKTEDYYPDNNPNLKVAEEVNWTIGVYNHMGSLEYVVVRVKLLNSTQPSPNQLVGSPSPASPLFEFTRVLLDNETLTIPFEWKITNVTLERQSVLITGLSLNQLQLGGELVKALSGRNYRFVFELWVLDARANDLSFSWSGMGGRHSAWVQIWFNVTRTISA